MFVKKTIPKGSGKSPSNQLNLMQLNITDIYFLKEVKSMFPSNKSNFQGENDHILILMDYASAGFCKLEICNYSNQ